MLPPVGWVHMARSNLVLITDWNHSHPSHSTFPDGLSEELFTRG
jgi:hypothetical protein